MKAKLTKPLRRRKRHLSFNPSHQDIADAVDEYLKQGGKITQLEAQQDRSKDDTWLTAEDTKDADEFLKEY